MSKSKDVFKLQTKKQLCFPKPSNKKAWGVTVLTPILSATWRNCVCPITHTLTVFYILKKHKGTLSICHVGFRTERYEQPLLYNNYINIDPPCSSRLQRIGNHINSPLFNLWFCEVYYLQNSSQCGEVLEWILCQKICFSLQLILFLHFFFSLITI